MLHTSDKLLLVATGRLKWLLPWRRAAAWCSGLCTLQVMGKQAQGLRLASGRQGAAGSSPARAIVAACKLLHCQNARQMHHTRCIEAVAVRSHEDAHQQRTLDGASLRDRMASGSSCCRSGPEVLPTFSYDDLTKAMHPDSRRCHCRGACSASPVIRSSTLFHVPTCSR